MEEVSLSPGSTLNPSEITGLFPPHRRRPLRSRTYDTLVRILSHCRQIQGSVSEKDGSTTLVSDPTSKDSEDKVVRETSDGETKGKTDFHDSAGKQAAIPELRQLELVRDGEQELTPSNEISIDDYLVVEELTIKHGVQNTTTELENVNSALDIEMDGLDALKDVGLDDNSCFHLSNEVLDSCFGSDMVVESLEAKRLCEEIGLEVNISNDMDHESQMKEIELEGPSCRISEEIEEGEISGDDGIADESFNELLEGASSLGEETIEKLHASEGYFDRDKLPFESNYEKVKSTTPAEQLRDRCYQDDPNGSQMETPKSSDITSLLENASEKQISMSPEKEEDAGKNKRKRVLSKERRAKKKKKERIKRAEKNRELGVKRLKLPPPIPKPKKIVHCRHFLHGRCHEGEKCKFSHDTVPLTKSKPCGHFARNSCMKGDKCPYDHELSKYPCNNYTSNGFCSRGSECLFSHEIPVNSLSATTNVNQHDLIPPQQMMPEKQGLNPISKVNISELKPPSPMGSSGISHQKINSRLSFAANSPAHNLQAPKGISFLFNAVAPPGDTNKDKRNESSTKTTDSVKAPGGIRELNEISEGVAEKKPRGINFLSFAPPPPVDSSNKFLSNLLSNYNDETRKAAVISGGRLDASTSKEKANLDSGRGETALSFREERESTSKVRNSIAGWNANAPSFVRKAIESTLAFAAQLEL